uniref:Uncharacterized protein n=1 Tax=Arundo donax TaxID=35708 RepID=A0A0A8XQX1_ARUDO
MIICIYYHLAQLQERVSCEQCHCIFHHALFLVENKST